MYDFYAFILLWHMHCKAEKKIKSYGGKKGKVLSACLQGVEVQQRGRADALFRGARLPVQGHSQPKPMEPHGLSNTSSTFTHQEEPVEWINHAHSTHVATSDA